MVDIDEKGGIQVFVRDLLDAGLLNGNTLTCTRMSLSDQIKELTRHGLMARLYIPFKNPFKPTGGLRLLGGNLSPEYSAVEIGRG